jgi:RNA polymerase sigma-70 factor (ECF subfamily)
VSDPRVVVYCVVPRDLAPDLHDSLRRHYADAGSVEVVVEQRTTERRAGAKRRAAHGDPAKDLDRRKIRSSDGRRVADRRATLVSVEAETPLPRKARPFADRLVFHERLEPSTQQLEDADTARLVMRIQADDRDAFAELYMRYFDRLYGYMRIALRDPHEAEDATQHVFVKVLQAIETYERRPSRPFRAWLFMIARNHVVDQLRKAGRLDLTDPSELRPVREQGSDGEPELLTLGWITDRDLLLFVERLPEAQRQVLVLRYMLDLTTAEIAQVLSRTTADVRSLHHRGLSFLRARLAALGRTPEAGRGIKMRAWPRPAPVIRRRRFVLSA